MLRPETSVVASTPIAFAKPVLASNMSMASTETPPHAADTEGRTAPRARSETAVAWVLVIVTCGLAFFTFLGHSPLWNIDEGMHAAMSKDMVLSGDWITPRLNGEAFVDKPVLFTWLVAASLKVLGFSELAARLPSAVLATLVVLLTFVLGRSMGTVRTGLVSALVLATSLEFIVLARVVVHDMTLAACTTLSLVAWWWWYRGWGSARVHLVGFYAAIGLGLLAKGPLAVVLVGLVVVPFLALERRLDALFEMRLGWGALVTAAVAAPWYVAMEAANPGYLRTFFIGQNLLNFAGSEPRHPEPIWFYGVAVIGGLFPWSAYLPQAIWNAATKRPDDERTSFRFLLVWAISMLVFFSAASSKLLNYLLPAFPAAALLIGAAWDSFMDTPTPARRREYVASTAAVAVIFGTAVVWFAATGLARFRHRYDLDLGTIVAPLAVMTAGLFPIIHLGRPFRQFELIAQGQ